MINNEGGVLEKIDIGKKKKKKSLMRYWCDGWQGVKFKENRRMK